METARYALVAVNTAARQLGPLTAGGEREGTYHYAIPPELRGRLRAGQMVSVPFGSRRLSGIVTGLADVAPPLEIKEIAGLAGEEPVVIAAQIALARWMAREYLAPLGRALWLMLPPGIERRVEARVQAVATAVPAGVALTPNQQAVWEALRDGREVPLREVANLARVAGWREALTALEEKGLVRRRDVELPPAVRPRTERYLRATPDEAEAAALSRAPRQRALYEFLLARQAEGDDDGWVAQSEALAATAAGRAIADALVVRGLAAVQEREVWRDPLAGREFVLTSAPQLTPDQERALRTIEAAVSERRHETFLLHGVTGSGKTEIYLQAIAQVLAQGRRAVYLVPEIALTPQTIRRVAARFPGRLTVCHSALSLGERYDQWRRIKGGEVDVVVGPRSALLTPLRNLGLIVVDEEHDDSYKQGDSGVRYHAREAAVALGRIAEACVILGSATPDSVSACRARTGVYTLLSLPQRVLSHRQQAAAQQARLKLPADSARLRPLDALGEDLLYAELPPVEVVDLRQELREGNRSIFSRALQQLMASALAAQEQIILFLNRRGSATFVMCRDCGQVLECPRCDVPLSYHGQGRALVCHHCNHRRPVARVCPSCLSRRIKFFGLGTQRVVEKVREEFPQARVVRWDRDAVRRRGSHEEILRRFSEHEADILVGTQMVAKGLDLPLVTVVGVISADTALQLPDYRAGERTFQLLTQVAGRAGRSPLGGRVVIQTYTPEHYAIQAASRHDYGAFLRRELGFRRQHGYPPFGRLVRLLYTDEDQARVREQARELAAALNARIRELGLPGTEIIGPAPCLRERLGGRWRWQIVLRGPDPRPLLAGETLLRGWRIDVDPVDFG